jgi:hypothetical protein
MSYYNKGGNFVESKRLLSILLVFAMTFGLLLQTNPTNGSIVSAAENDGFTTSVYGFEDTSTWSPSAGVSITAVSEQKTEGSNAVQITFDSAAYDNQWPGAGNSLATPIDFSDADAIQFDIYPMSQTQGEQEPLVFKIGQNGVSTVYEEYLPKLTANEWNTVTITPRDGADRSNVDYMLFYMHNPDSGNRAEGRTEISYIVDNMKKVKIEGEESGETGEPEEPEQLPEGYTSVLLRGFDSLYGWKADDKASGSVYASLVSDNKTEGAYATRLAFELDTVSTDWINYSWNIDPTVDFTNVQGIKLDIYPDQQLDGGSEPLVIKIVGSEGNVYEDFLPQLTANQWNTVTITPWTVNNAIRSISFYIYTKDTKLGDNNKATYNLDNMRLIVEEEKELWIDFESTDQWSPNAGASIQTVDNPKTEGNHSLEINYDFSVNNEWIGVEYNFVSPVDLSSFHRIQFDVQSISQTNGNQEPLVIKIGGEGGIIYEEFLPKLTANEANTVTIVPREDVDRSNITYVLFYIHNSESETRLEGRESLTYYIDNMQTVSAKIDYVPKEVVSLTPIEIAVETAKAGNVFEESDNLGFNVTLTDFTFQDNDLDLSYQVRNKMTGKLVYEGSEDISMKAGGQVNINPLNIPISQHGIFDLKLKVTNDDGSINESEVITFSLVYNANTERGKGIFGVGTHFAQGKGDLDKNFSLAEIGGFQIIRDEMYWSGAEKTKGEVVIHPSWDAYVDTALDKGMETILILSYGNKLYDDGGIPVSEEGKAAFANYAAAMAKHFEGRISYFEVWNEPNIMGHPSFNPTSKTPEEYAELLKVTYEAIKEANPQATVLGGSTAGVDLSWFKRMFDVHGTDYLDAISIHPYSWPTGPEAGSFVTNMEATKDLIDNYGDLKPIWITEIGWPTHEGARGITESLAAAYVARTNVLAMSIDGIEKIIWYDLQDDGTNAEEPEDNFGLLKNWNDNSNPWGAKEGFVAYNTLTTKLSGAEFSEYLKPDTTLNLYKFQNDGKDIVVAWNMYSSKTMGLKVGEGDFTVTDIFGNSESYYAVDGVISPTVSDFPIYIEGDIPELAVGTPVFSTQSSKINAVEGETFTITIERSPSAYDIPGQFDLDLPEDWKLIGTTDFAAGTDPIELTVQIPNGTEKGTYDVNVNVMSNDLKVANIAMYISVVDPLQVTILPEANIAYRWEEWDLKIELNNITGSSTLDGTLTITEPAAWAGTFEFGSIGAGETETITIPVHQPDQTLYNFKAEVELSSGFTMQITRPVSFLAAAKMRISPDINGILKKSEWMDAMQINLDSAEQVRQLPEWGGIDDLSAKAWIKWDDENIYLAVDVKDDVHNQGSTDGDIWRGDGIQFAIDPVRAEGAGSKGYHEMGAALGNDGEIYKWRWGAAVGKETGALDSAIAAVVRTGTNTIYEIAVPWDDILPDGTIAKEGYLLGISILVNDVDEGTKRGWIEYMSGIGSSKDPTLYGDLILTTRGKDGAPDPKVMNEMVYVVKPGDVLSRIAQKYGLSWKALAEYNKLKNPHLILSGQEIKIPGVAKP